MKALLIDLSNYKSFRVTRSRRIPVFGALVLLFLLLYFFTNRVHLIEPRQMTMFEWERQLPLIPWTAWIYASDYIYPLIIGLMLKSDLVTTRVCWAFFIQTIVANTSFFVFPVVFPRELWPHDPSDFLIDWIRTADTAANCFPSSHVAIVVLTYVAWIRERPKQPWFFLIWGLAICVSTMTTKQHYFVDILAGIVLGTTSYLAAERIVSDSRPLSSST